MQPGNGSRGHMEGAWELGAVQGPGRTTTGTPVQPSAHWLRQHTDRIPLSAVATSCHGERTSLPGEVRRTVPAPFCEWYSLGGEDEPLRMMHSAAALIRVQLPAAADVKTNYVRTAVSEACMTFIASYTFLTRFLPQLAGRLSGVLHGPLQRSFAVQNAP